MITIFFFHDFLIFLLESHNHTPLLNFQKTYHNLSNNFFFSSPVSLGQPKLQQTGINYFCVDDLVVQRLDL